MRYVVCNAFEAKDYKLIPIWEDRNDLETNEEPQINAIVPSPGVRRGTQAFSTIPDALQGFAIEAQKIVTNCKPYRKRLLTLEEVLLLI